MFKQRGLNGHHVVGSSLGFVLATERKKTRGSEFRVQGLRGTTNHSRSFKVAIVWGLGFSRTVGSKSTRLSGVKFRGVTQAIWGLANDYRRK